MPMIAFLCNKYVISLIAASVICLSTHTVTRRYYVSEYEKQIASLKYEYQLAASTSETKHANEIESLNDKIHTLQDTLTIKTRELTHALNKQSNAAIAGLNTGTIRLHDKYATTECTPTKPDNTADSNTPIRQPDNRISTGRELSRQTSENLIRLATDAEQTNIALKSCIAQYNTIKETLHEQDSH